MNEELKIIIKAVTDSAQKAIKEVSKELNGVTKAAKDSSANIGTALKGVAKGAAVAAAAIAAVGAAVVGLGKNSIDFTKEQAKLIASFQAVGASAEQAQRTYNGLYRFLGDSGKATEAASHLALITQEQEKLAEWTRISQGVYATFGDSLPIEGLAEAANETLRVGKVTGTLADALNWVGVSEDAFNRELAQTSSLEEREALIRSTLNNLYGNAADIYESNNKVLLDYNESQANLQKSTAELGATVIPLLTYLNNLGTAIVTLLKPAFELVLPYVAGFVLWLTEAVNRMAVFLGFTNSASDSVESLGNTVKSSIKGATSSTTILKDGLEEVEKAAEDAKRAAMGFDELNIVPSGKSANTGNSDTGSIDTMNVPSLSDMGLTGITGLAGTLEDFHKKAEAVRDSINEWMDKWGWTLDTIAAILAGLSIRHLIIQFAEVVGLGEKFAKALSFTGIAAGVQKLAGWLSAVVGLLAEGYGFWEVMGVAFPKLAAVITKVGTALTGAAKAAVAFIGGLSASTIAIIVAAVAALASGVYFLWQNWDAVVQKVKEFCNTNLVPILNEMKGHFTALWGAIKEVGAAFVDVGAAIWNALPKGLQDWLYSAGKAIRDVAVAIGEWFASVPWLKGIGIAIEGLGGIVVGIVGGVIAGAIQAILNQIESAVQIVTGAIQIISGILSGFANLILGIFTGDFSKCKDSVELIWEGIKNVFKGAVDAVIGTVWGFIKGVIDFFKHMWDVLVGHSIVPDTINAIIEWFAYLPVRVFKLLAEFVQGVINFFADLAVSVSDWAVNIWNNIKSAFAGAPKWFSDRWTDIKNALKDIPEWFSEKFQKAIDEIKRIFADPASYFREKWNGIKDVFKDTKEWFRDKFNSAREAIEEKFEPVTEFFEGIWEDIQNVFKDVKNWFKKKFEEAEASTETAFQPITKFFQGIWNDITVTFKDVKVWFQKRFEEARIAIEDVFRPVGQFFTTTWNTIVGVFQYCRVPFKRWFADAWKAVKDVFAPVGKFFSDLWEDVKKKFTSFGVVIGDSIGGAFKSIINSVLRTVESKINDAISIINGAIRVINKLPGVNVGSVSYVSLPRLAKGGIVNSATTALIGEAGREAVLPLENNTDWMDKLADRIAARNNSPSKIVLQIGEKELGWATINAINGITAQTGRMQLSI